MRPINGILYSSHFARAVKKLPPLVQQEAGKREIMFRRDCFDARLKTHKLKGGQPERWSFSINYQYRILFRFIDSETAYFLDVGDHSIYQ